MALHKETKKKQKKIIKNHQKTMKIGLGGDLGTSCILEIGFWPVWRGVSNRVELVLRWELWPQGDLGTSCILEIGFWPVWRGVSTVLWHGTRWELCHGIRNAEQVTQKKCTGTVLCGVGEVWGERYGLCDPHTSMWATRVLLKESRRG